MLFGRIAKHFQKSSQLKIVLQYSNSCFQTSNLTSQYNLKKYEILKSSLQKTSNSFMHTTSALYLTKDSVTITFIDRTGTKILVKADVGDTLLDVAKDYDIDGVEGACGGTLACSTCHCVFKREDFDALELENISEEELDMLDLAFGLTDTSRLVCAIEVTEEMDGIEITVPVSTRDARGEAT